MFQDRSDAGARLAEALLEYRDLNSLVLAIPRGGVEVGWEVATRIGAEFSVLVVRKLPFPDNPEAGFGAIAEDGSIVLVDRALHGLAPQTVQRVLDRQKREVRRRIQTLRGGEPLPELKDRLVILVDDGLAMGSTMRAAVLVCKKRQAARVIVAVPVSGPRAFRAVRAMADRVVALEQPRHFRAVAEAYLHWHDASDQEVLQILGTPRAARGPSRDREPG